VADYSKQYPHIFAADAPSLIRAYAPLIGVAEKRGPGNNPVIMEWAREVGEALGVSLGYTADKIPWCGLGMAYVALKAGWLDQTPRQPLWARAWLKFGQKADKPSFGDILVFGREGGGHVGVYVAESAGHFHVLGSNQGDAVNIRMIPKARLLGARRPIWRKAQPASVRPIHMGANGVATTGEA